MGYPEDTLAPDEQLVLHSHPHWKMLLIPALVFILATGIAGVALGLAFGNLDDTIQTVALIAIAVIWLALVAWQTVAPLISWRTTHFVVTDRRVMTREGIVTRSGIDIPLSRINSIQFRHGLIDRMVRTGTLIIESASDDPLEFDDIPNVEKVHSLLYHEVFDATNDDDGRSWDQRGDQYGGRRGDQYGGRRGDPRDGGPAGEPHYRR